MVINLYKGSASKAIKYNSSKEVVTVQDTVCDYVVVKPLEPRSTIALLYIFTPTAYSFFQEKIFSPVFQSNL